jgi:hypothetical protein
MASADRFETKQFKAYKRKLEMLGADVLPRVIAETINVVAGFAHVQSIRNVRSRFVNRNRYTENSVRFYKANPKAKIWKINAISGSISDYMDEQDSGGERVPKQGGKVPVATLAARGGDPKRVVRKANKAGQLGPNQFIGTPRGSLSRPHGVYQRNKKNKYLVMIRNISRVRVEIEGRHWHRDAVEFRYRREVLTGEFIRQAEREIARLQSST